MLLSVYQKLAESVANAPLAPETVAQVKKIDDRFKRYVAAAVFRLFVFRTVNFLDCFRYILSPVANSLHTIASNRLKTNIGSLEAMYALK